MLRKKKKKKKHKKKTKKQISAQTPKRPALVSSVQN